MNTQLIYVSKETAQVSNDKDGTFTNEVSQGILVKKGDDVSVQGVAINSQGVGTNIIEIPSIIKDNNFQPNKQVIRGAMYINHNQQYTCKLPTNEMKQIQIDKTGTDSPNYGYLTTAGSTTLPFVNNLTKREELSGYGSRYYLGTFTRKKDDVDAVVNPPFDPTSSNNQNLYPNYLTFNFLTTDLKFEVDVGYDNPDNIANKITTDLHSADIIPQNSVLYNLNDIPTSFSENNTTLVDDETQQFIASSKNSSSYLIYGIPQPNKNQTGIFYSLYQSIFGVSNPFYWYYGSRMLSSDGNLKNLSYLNYDWNSGIYDNPPIFGNIYNVFTFPTKSDTDGEYVDISDGYVMTTNLPYEQKYLEDISKFIHSQKRLKKDTIVSSQDLIDKRADHFFTYIDIGRFNDNAPRRWLNADNDPYSGVNALVSHLYNAPTKSTKLSTMNNAPITDTFFQTEFYNKAYLDLSSDESASADETIKLFTGNIIIDGINLTPIQIAKKYDINIIPVDSGVNGNGEVCIGIILRSLNLQDTAIDAKSSQRRVRKGNYVLVDFTFFNPPAEAVILLNPARKAGGSDTDIDDYTKLLQVGSPNINLNFDGVRGKFNFQNLYWANFIGNPADGTEAVATAGQEVITANHLLGTSTYGIKIGSNPSPQIPYLKHSQSGIGILDIGAIDNEDNILLMNNNQDNINNIYEKSLLKLLGFTYQQLTNSYGLPDTYFTQRHYNSSFKLPYQNNFPYPLTNNPEIDTEKNIGLSVNNAGLPMFNLSNEKNNPNINLSASTSKIFAVNNPNKLLFPYWLIQSDIIDGVDFNSMNSGNKQNIVAVCNRAYIAGDFAFSFANTYSFKATKDFVISSIKTAILNPDLTPASIDNKTAIIYQVQSPIPLFQQQQIAEEEELSKKTK